MTYFAFLLLFVGIPIFMMGILNYRSKNDLPAALNNRQMWFVIFLHSLVALVYTTPWDNYLVATQVWWYDPALVTGMTIGYVPIEEYTFFVVQPIFTGLFLLLLIRYLPINPVLANNPRIRMMSTLAVGFIWLGSIIILVSAWQPGIYLGLELIWALPPIMLQLGFGADILWRHRRIVLLGIMIPTVYLSVADSIAIGAGTWTISPEQSTGVLIGSLPIEEFLFFLLTNILIVFGSVLFLATESQDRLRNIIGRISNFQQVEEQSQPLAEFQSHTE